MYCLVDGVLKYEWRSETDREYNTDEWGKPHMRKGCPLVFTIKNNHIYPYFDKRIISSIVRGAKKMVVSKDIEVARCHEKDEPEPEKPEQPVLTDEDGKVLEWDATIYETAAITIQKFVRSRRRNWVILEVPEGQDKLDYVSKLMKEKDCMIHPSNNLIMRDNEISNFKLKGITYITNYNEILHEHYGKDYNGQSPASIVYDLDLFKDPPRS
jgi:hypothetical protein